MRCFLAIELPGEVLDRVAALQEELGRTTRGVRWTRPAQIHLTLKFLGEVPDADIAQACTAVAEAAMKSGVAKSPVDIEEYRERLREKADWTREIMRKIFLRARREPKRIVFPEGMDPKIIWAASELVREGIAKPVLLGRSKQEVLDLIEELHHSSDGIEIIEPKSSFRRQTYINEYYRMNQRKGISQDRAAMDMRNYINFGLMMVQMGDADGMVAGVSQSFHEVLQPAMRIIGPKKKGGLAAGMYMLLHEDKLYCMADCSVNPNPSVEELVSITLLAASELKNLQMEPRIAMLSFSNFGTLISPESEKVAKAVELIKERRPDLMVDGPVQADMALDPEFMQKRFPFTSLKARPNLLIFPNLDAGNISLRLLRKLGKAHTIGPVMIGMAKPVQLLPVGVDVNQIINLAAMAVVDAQERAEPKAVVEELMV